MFHDKALHGSVSIHGAKRIEIQKETLSENCKICRITIKAPEDGLNTYPDFMLTVFFDRNIKPEIVRLKEKK